MIWAVGAEKQRLPVAWGTDTCAVAMLPLAPDGAPLHLGRSRKEGWR